jgi:ssDNA-binding Zn-finger/Zn-ribbon topoisomerase 1
MAEGEEEGAQQPLDAEERENIRADLDDLGAMRTAFETQGVKGVVVACPDCGSDHYYGWELLKESLEHMLETGEPRMHEPAYEPREEEYILWDYGKGYVDALADAGLDDGTPVEVDVCAWCETPLEPHFAYCPKCGRPTAPARLLRELVARGMDERDARSLLIKAGFEPFG